MFIDEHHGANFLKGLDNVQLFTYPSKPGENSHYKEGAISHARTILLGHGWMSVC